MSYHRATEVVENYGIIGPVLASLYPGAITGDTIYIDGDYHILG